MEAEFKREAVKLVGQPGASKAAVAYDLGIGGNLLGRWCRDANVDAEAAVGREKVSSQEYERMRRELAKVKTERMLKTRSATSRTTSSEARLHRQISNHLAHANDVPATRRIVHNPFRPTRGTMRTSNETRNSPFTNKPQLNNWTIITL